MNLKQALQIIEDRLSTGRMPPKIIFEFSENDEGEPVVDYATEGITLSDCNFESFEEALIELAKDLAGVK